MWRWTVFGVDEDVTPLLLKPTNICFKRKIKCLSNQKYPIGIRKCWNKNTKMVFINFRRWDTQIRMNLILRRIGHNKDNKQLVWAYRAIVWTGIVSWLYLTTIRINFKFRPIYSRSKHLKLMEQYKTENRNKWRNFDDLLESHFFEFI